MRVHTEINKQKYTTLFKYEHEKLTISAALQYTTEVGNLRHGWPVWVQVFGRAFFLISNYKRLLPPLLLAD